jgi:hypothetical protein
VSSTGSSAASANGICSLIVGWTNTARRNCSTVGRAQRQREQRDDFVAVHAQYGGAQEAVVPARP